MPQKLGTGVRLASLEKTGPGSDSNLAAKHAELEARVVTLEAEFNALKAVFAPAKQA